MEKKDWREELKQHIFAECFKDQVDIQWYEDFIEQELDKAREEGKRELLLEFIKIDNEQSEFDQYSVWSRYIEEQKSKLLKE